MTCHSRPSLFFCALIAIVVLRGGSCLKIQRPYPTPTASEVVAALQARNRAIHTLRAEARMSHKTNQGIVKATVRTLLKRGGKLRFDVVSPFDTPLATLISDGTNFVLIDTKENRFSHGPASPCNLARLLRVQLQADDLLAILGGSSPLIEYNNLALFWDDQAGQEILVLSGKELEQHIRLDSHQRQWNLVRSEIRNDKGVVLLQIEVERDEMSFSKRFPTKLTLRQPIHNTTLSLNFRNKELNIPLSDAAFVLPKSNGLPAQMMECENKSTLR
ncbi:MAG: DUF4292 domain-containing protein [Pseudomonadota bacterium]